MSALLPVALYGLKVPAGDVMIPALMDLPATFRITMAAIDPSAPPEYTGTANGDTPARATLKIIYDPSGPLDNDESDGESEEEYLESLMRDDDEDHSSEEEGENGGPSDPSKTKKARKQAAAEQMMKSLADDDTDDEMNIDGDSSQNGALSKAKKGKAKATAEDEESGDTDDDDLDGLDELVLCTLDPSKNYQQPLDITIGEDQRAYFKVSGTHAVYLTGNYLMPVDDGHNQRHEIYDDEDDVDYDLSPDEAELDGSSETDELDDLQDPRITELGSEEDDEPPKLIKKGEPGKGNKKEEPAKGNKKDESAKGDKKEDSAKGNKKRVAEDSDEEPANLDDIMAKALKPADAATNGEPKLSKKQLKKLKNNAGKAVQAAVENKGVEKTDEAAKDNANSKADKKVQFAKDLEQGPSSTVNDTKSNNAAEAKTESKKDGEKPKATLGPRTVQGVEIDDRKLGKGPAAKNGSKVSMRYIGKLQDGKVFDANKKGPPFSFTLGTGEVIKGWDIGIQGMSVGGERRITIPAHLAYGNKAKPGIPANSKLIFDIKMVEVK